jgi:hypothetical protein
MINSPSFHGLSAQDLAKLLSHDFKAFVQDGRLFKVIPEDDDDCHRNSVEECVNGKWNTVVVASLDWRRELDEEMQAQALAA